MLPLVASWNGAEVSDSVGWICYNSQITTLLDLCTECCLHSLALPGRRQGEGKDVMGHAQQHVYAYTPHGMPTIPISGAGLAFPVRCLSWRGLENSDVRHPHLSSAADLVLSLEGRGRTWRHRLKRCVS